MATRSTIAYQNPTTGKIAQVYCHFDGNLANNGLILARRYKDDAKVQRLVSSGDMSSLDTIPELCNFYHRDQGHPFSTCQPRTFESFNAYKFDGQMEDFNYLYSHGQWYLIDVAKRSRVLLSDLLANELPSLVYAGLI